VSHPIEWLRPLLAGEGSRLRSARRRDWFPRLPWRNVDSLYIWSAVAGLFVALAMIAVARFLETGHLR
jgi:hypothetical protein